MIKRCIKIEKTAPYLFAAVLAFLVFHLLNQNMELALKPHVTAMWILYQMQFEFIPNIGYGEVHGLFIIGMNCLGGKLFICLFFILVICRLDSFNGIIKKIYKIQSYCVFSVLLSYTITMFRIAASVPFCQMSDFKLIHTLLSLMIYFGSGLGLYAILNTPLRGEGGLGFEDK